MNVLFSKSILLTNNSLEFRGEIVKLFNVVILSTNWKNPFIKFLIIIFVIFCTKNYKRVAMVWMDEYAEFIYKRRPSYRHIDQGIFIEFIPNIQTYILGVPF